MADTIRCQAPVAEKSGSDPVFLGFLGFRKRGLTPIFPPQVPDTELSEINVVVCTLSDQLLNGGLAHERIQIDIAQGSNDRIGDANVTGLHRVEEFADFFSNAFFFTANAS